MLWFLKQELAARYEHAIRLGGTPTAAQLERFTQARARASSDGGPACLTIAGDVAQISVAGILTPEPDFWAWLLFGANTSYREIREALDAAAMNPAVKRVEWLFSSPGGMVNGYFDLLPAIETFSKPSTVRASMACSAAYGLATMAGKIEATSPASEFGSVGCVRGYYVEGPGASEILVEVTSTDAPNKRPDVTTSEGLAVVRAELDVQHDLLADGIARGRTRAGRKTSLKEVNAEFGRGGSVYAEDAREKGMIDKSPPRKPRGATSASGEEEVHAPEMPPEPTTATAPVGAQTKVKSIMNKKEMQEQHPEVYAAILAEGRAEGVTQGQAAERDRCVGHLTMGEASGDMKTAIEAVTNGAGMTATINAKYMAASMNRRDQSARQQESDTVGEATRTAAAPAGGVAKDLGDRMADAMGLPPSDDTDPKAPKR